MKLGIAGRIHVIDADLADTVEDAKAVHLCYTDVVLLMSADDESCRELGQDWAHALNENDGPTYEEWSRQVA